jgi:hypothetical protein
MGAPTGLNDSLGPYMAVTDERLALPAPPRCVACNESMTDGLWQIAIFILHLGIKI